MIASICTSFAVFLKGLIPEKLNKKFFTAPGGLYKLHKLYKFVSVSVLAIVQRVLNAFLWQRL